MNFKEIYCIVPPQKHLWTAASSIRKFIIKMIDNFFTGNDSFFLVFTTHFEMFSFFNRVKERSELANVVRQSVNPEELLKYFSQYTEITCDKYF